MSRCDACHQPMHPQQMTCGSCGASRSGPPDTRTAKPGGDPSEEFLKPDAAEEFVLEDPVELGTSDIAEVEREPSPMPPPTGRTGDRKAARKRSKPASSRAFVSRGWALVVDIVVLAIASTMLPFFIRLGIRAAEGVTGRVEIYDDVLTREIAEVGRIALVASYFVFMNAGRGQTLGKSLMGLQVVQTDGTPPDALRSLVRLIGYVFSLMPLGVGFLVAAFSPRRGLHDYLAGTIVIRPGESAGTGSEEAAS